MAQYKSMGIAVINAADQAILNDTVCECSGMRHFSPFPSRHFSPSVSFEDFALGVCRRQFSRNDGFVLPGLLMWDCLPRQSHTCGTGVGYFWPCAICPSPPPPRAAQEGLVRGATSGQLIPQPNACAKKSATRMEGVASRTHGFGDSCAALRPLSPPDSLVGGQARLGALQRQPRQPTPPAGGGGA